MTRGQKELKIQTLSKRINNIPNFLQQHQIQPNLINPISDLTKKDWAQKQEEDIREKEKLAEK